MAQKTKNAPTPTLAGLKSISKTKLVLIVLALVAVGVGIKVFSGASGKLSTDNATTNPYINSCRPPHTGVLLQRGSSGNCVRYLQYSLARQPTGGTPDLKPDGSFGPATDAAVRKFQKANKDLNGVRLEVDGIVGPKTWGRLDKNVNPGRVTATPTPTPAKSKPAISGHTLVNTASYKLTACQIGGTYTDELHHSIYKSVRFSFSTATNAENLSIKSGSTTLVGFGAVKSYSSLSKSASNVNLGNYKLVDNGVSLESFQIATGLPGC